MNSELDQMNWWDDLSCREWEEFLDEMYWESRVDQLEDEYNEAMERRAYMEGSVTGRDF